MKHSENHKYLAAVLFSPKVAFLNIFSKCTKDLILEGATHPVLLLSLLGISGIKSFTVAALERIVLQDNFLKV